MPLGWALLYVGFLIAVTFLVAKISYDLFESKILALKIYFRPRYGAMAPRVCGVSLEAENFSTACP